MNWFILALIAPLCWSIANYLDKFILSRSKNEVEGGSGGLLILSCLVSLFFAFCIYLGNHSVTLLSPQESGALIFSGMFEALYLIFYFWALERESTTTVISLFQFAPIMGLLFGYLILSEVPSPIQVFAIILILTGTLFIVYKKGEKFFAKRNVILLMVVSTLFVGFYNTLFKMVGEQIPFWTAVFWQYIGISIIGFIFFAVSPLYRQQTIAMLFKRGGAALVLTLSAELMNIGAILATNAAVLLAPVAIVLSVSSFQPLFVLLEGVLLMWLFPKFLSKDDRPSFKIQYIAGIVLVCIGGFLIY